MKVFLALPVLNESENLPSLLDCIGKQSFRNYELFVCVNQPDHWWNDDNKRPICEDNKKSITLLGGFEDFPVRIIDRSSPGTGWKAKHFGVGWARKTCMDAINEIAGGEDLILSIDADTFYPHDYLQSVVELFKNDDSRLGLANPYYHKLTADLNLNRAILRYEIYMRNYSINMLMISNPHAFTALGSAMAFPVWAYRKVNGITPHKSGEDFYFLQKLRKSGKLLVWNNTVVNPSARKSDRVFFGTGPAIIKGIDDNWESYPVYHHRLFREVEKTFGLFEDMFENPVQTRMTDYLNKQFREEDFTAALRENSNTAAAFASACMRKIDALRILQFLKEEEKSGDYKDEISLSDNFRYFELPLITPIKKLAKGIGLNQLDVDELSEIRELMFNLEGLLQKKIYLPG